MDSWEDFAVRPPTHIFTERLELAGGIELRHVGGQHAPDSTVVAAIDSSVMLLGDCFYPPCRSTCAIRAPSGRRSICRRSLLWWRSVSTGTSTATALRGACRRPDHP